MVFCHCGNRCSCLPSPRRRAEGNEEIIRSGAVVKESRAVHLEGVGWFRYTTQSSGKGVATKEEVSSDQITGLRVQFTPERTRNMSGGYDRALIADEGITFMEWLGKESDETQIPEEGEDEGGSPSGI